MEGRREELAQALFDHIPVGVGSQGIIPTTAGDLEAALEMGMDWSLREVGGPSLQLGYYANSRDADLRARYCYGPLVAAALHTPFAG